MLIVIVADLQEVYLKWKDPMDLVFEGFKSFEYMSETVAFNFCQDNRLSANQIRTILPLCKNVRYTDYLN